MMSRVLTFDDLEVGLSLKPVQENITQEGINTYGEVAGDVTSLYVEPEWVKKKSPLCGMVAHGMTSLSFVSRLMSDNFGNAWLFGGTLSVSFKQPVKPGDTILAKAKVIKKTVDETKKVAEFSVLCENQKRDVVITGRVTITF